MKLLFFIFAQFIFYSNLQANIIEKEFSFKDYASAQNAQASFLNFEIKSTKVGIFTSTVNGYVKKFKFKSELDKTSNVAKNSEIFFNVDELDTDSTGRNEKMHEYCLEKSKTPQISVKVPEFNVKYGEEIMANAIMNIRGKDKPIKLMIKLSLKEKIVSVEGKGEVRFTELEVPDPSIAIAKVDDTIKLKFKIEFENE